MDPPKKIWVNDGHKVTEYSEAPKGHAAQPAPVAPSAVSSDHAIQEPTAMVEAPTNAGVVADQVQAVSATPAANYEYDPKTGQFSEIIDDSQAKSLFSEGLKAAARSSPRAAAAYGRDAVAGGRRLGGRAAELARSLNAKYEEAKPALNAKYAGIAQQLAAQQQPQRRASRAKSGQSRRRTAGMRRGPGARAPGIKIVNRR